MEIAYLADYPAFVAPLADYHHAEWHPVLPWWTHAEALAELTDHTHRRAALPTTLVAVEAGELLGSVSLIVEDLTERDIGELARLTPWLASLYVLPAARGRTVGRRLVAAVSKLAADLGVETLYLFTSGQERFYRPLGWDTLARFPYLGGEGVVMRYPLSPSVAR
jgi:GNAT superfamily N-acetyltransferase